MSGSVIPSQKIISQKNVNRWAQKGDVEKRIRKRPRTQELVQDCSEVTESPKIEVTHFEVTEATYEQLLQFRGQGEKMEIYKEMFWDTKDHNLAKNNLWLRVRTIRTVPETTTSHELCLKRAGIFDHSIGVEMKWTEKESIRSIIEDIVKPSRDTDDIFCDFELFPLGSMVTYRHVIREEKGVLLYVDESLDYMYREDGQDNVTLRGGLQVTAVGMTAPPAFYPSLKTLCASLDCVQAKVVQLLPAVLVGPFLGKQPLKSRKYTMPWVRERAMDLDTYNSSTKKEFYFPSVPAEKKKDIII